MHPSDSKITDLEMAVEETRIELVETQDTAEALRADLYIQKTSSSTFVDTLPDVGFLMSTA